MLSKIIGCLASLALLLSGGTPISAKEADDALFKIWDGTRWGFIDRTGREVIAPKYTVVEDVDGLSYAARLTNGKWVLVTSSGERPLYDGPAEYLFPCGDGIFGHYTKDFQRVYFDAKGVLKLPPGHIPNGDFSEGLLPIRAEGMTGYADRNGKVVLQTSYDRCGSFSEGLASFRKDRSFGYLNRAGEVVIEPMPAVLLAGPFHEGLAAVADAKKMWYIRQDGTTAFPTAFARAGDFVDGLAVVQVGKDGPYGFIDLNGTFKIQPKFRMAKTFSEGLAMVELGGSEYGYVDRDGNTAFTARARRGAVVAGATDFQNGLAWISRSGDPREGRIGPPEYRAEPWKIGYYVDKHGDIIWQTKAE